MVSNALLLDPNLQEKRLNIFTNSDSKKTQKLYEFWTEITPIKLIYTEKKRDTMNQPLRSLILKILRRGVIDSDLSQELKTQIRYALNPKEILYLANQELERKVKLPNIYFHLDKLQETGLIQQVVTLFDGRYEIRYFGRTAKFFLYLTPDAKEDRLNENTLPIFNSLYELTRSINPNVQKQELTLLFKQYLMNRRNQTEKIIEWIKKHENLLVEFNIDIADLYNFLKTLLSDQQTFQTHQKISQLINLDFT
ncbi:MAG: hypothetical protein ACFFC7_05095 [Candidatus Hermodarchaeota archaeon]